MNISWEYHIVVFRSRPLQLIRPKGKSSTSVHQNSNICHFQFTFSMIIQCITVIYFDTMSEYAYVEYRSRIAPELEIDHGHSAYAKPAFVPSTIRVFHTFLQDAYVCYEFRSRICEIKLLSHLLKFMGSTLYWHSAAQAYGVNRSMRHSSSALDMFCLYVCMTCAQATFTKQ